MNDFEEAGHSANTLARAIASAVRVGLMRYLPVGPHRNADHAAVETEMAQHAHLVLKQAHADEHQPPADEEPELHKAAGGTLTVDAP